jgi:hypothetical protein
MSNQQHPKQQSRPSLYESSGTTSAFSILSAAQPLGWSKQKSIGLSIISFIAGGVLTGGAVGLIKSTDQPVAQLTDLVATKPVSVMPKSIPESEEKPITPPPIAHQTPDIQVKSALPISNQPIAQDPLASFKNNAIQENARLKPTVQKNHNSNGLAKNGLAVKDDAELQRLIERKTQHEDSVAKASAGNTKLVKSKREKVSSAQHVVANQKKPLAHDKDVLLVKSMLDTMDHPLTVNITTRPKPADGNN